MECPSCSSAVADGRRFCPSCGTPQTVLAGAGASRGAEGAAGAPQAAPAAGGPLPATRAIVLPDAGGEAPATTGATGPVTSSATAAAPPATPAAPPVADGRTQVFETPAEAPRRADGPGLRDRLAPAGAAVGRRADELADRYRTAPPDVRIALIGAVVVVLSFLFLPYVGDRGTAARIGGRLWWLPLTAVAATALLATTLRTRRARSGDDAPAARPAGTGSAVDRLLAALVIATVGATEAGLVGLVSGDARGARLGYYGMLAGLVTVMFATIRAARRRCGAPVASDGA